MDIKINGEVKEAVFSLETLSLYEEEFGRDLLQDVMGKATFDPNAEAENAEKAERGVITIDYTEANWLAVIRALWAALKVADQSLPSYKSWSKGISAVNMAYINNLVVPEVIDKFFRPQPEDEEQ